MPALLRRYLLTIAVFLGLDMIWIVGLMFRFYDTQLGALALRGPDGKLAAALGPTLLVYLLIPAGLVAFAQAPVREGRHGWLRAALFGLVCYGTYDLSNLATLRGWPLPVVIADMAWGTTVAALSSVIVVAIERRLGAARR